MYPKRVNMHHSLIDPAKLHVVEESRRHQKMHKSLMKMHKSLMKMRARVWSRLVQICGVLPCLSFRLLATPQGACSSQQRPAKDAPKIASHLSNPRGRTWTARDQFFAPFTVVNNHVAGNTVVNSYLEFGTIMTGMFPRKTLSFERCKSFESSGCVVNPFGRTNPLNKKGCN